MKNFDRFAHVSQTFICPSRNVSFFSSVSSSFIRKVFFLLLVNLVVVIGWKKGNKKGWFGSACMLVRRHQFSRNRIDWKDSNCLGRTLTSLASLALVLVAATPACVACIRIILNNLSQVRSHLHVHRSRHHLKCVLISLYHRKGKDAKARQERNLL
jgi:hypothetical protein